MIEENRNCKGNRRIDELKRTAQWVVDSSMVQKSGIQAPSTSPRANDKSGLDASRACRSGAAVRPRFCRWRCPDVCHLSPGWHYRGAKRSRVSPPVYSSSKVQVHETSVSSWQYDTCWNMATPNNITLAPVFGEQRFDCFEQVTIGCEMLWFARQGSCSRKIWRYRHILLCQIAILMQIKTLY